MRKTMAFLGGAAFGTGLMYLADPVLGKRRRALARDFAVHSAKVLGRIVDITSRDTAHRIRGIFEESRSLFNHEQIDDQVLMDRVRTEVGRYSSHPNVQIMVQKTGRNQCRFAGS